MAAGRMAETGKTGTDDATGAEAAGAEAAGFADGAGFAQLAGEPAIICERGDIPAVLPSPADERDPRGAQAVLRARDVLEQTAPAEQIGQLADLVDQGDGVFAVRFQAIVPGYPGWLWTASMTQLEGEEPSVLEAGLLPGGQALLAPPWVPWADRLAEYEASRAAEGTDGEPAEEPAADALPSGDGAAEDAGDAVAPPASRRRQRRLRTRLRRGERLDARAAGHEPVSAQAAHEVPDAAAEAPCMPDASGEAPRGEALADQSSAPLEEAPAAPGEGAASGPRSPRRRIIVVPHAEAAASPGDAGRDGDDDFVEVEDVREFADDMDDVLDGVEFEEDDADDEADL